jgi:uncharacterized protein
MSMPEAAGMGIETLLWLLVALMIVGGLAGLVLPVLPGAALLLAGLVLAAWIEDFQYVGAKTIAILVLLAGLVFLVDFVAGMFGARRFGASPRAAIGAGIGALIGIWFGLIGILLGPFIGAIAGELSARRTFAEAGRAGVGTAIGLAIGAAVKFALALTMIGLFLLARFAF